MEYKKLLKNKILFIFFLTAVLLSSSLCFILSAGSANQDSNTTITPHLFQKIVKGKNIVYCSTFQLAWNELRDKIIREDIKLENQPAMVGILNKKYASKADLSENSYFATAGYGKQNIINKINEALTRKFGKDAPKVKDRLGPEDIIAYAYLYKNLAFSPAFEDLKNPVRFNSSCPVKGFGIDSVEDKHRKIIEQVEIPYYKNDNEFVVKLTPKVRNDEIFLAKVAPKATLYDTLKYVQSKNNLYTSDFLEEGDSLQVPKFEFKLEKSYKELENKHLLNKNFKDYYISKAIQNIDFKLNEKGAILKSEAKMVVALGCLPVQKNKYLIFDRPFLIYLKEKKSNNPYLVIWAENTDLFVRK